MKKIALVGKVFRLILYILIISIAAAVAAMLLFGLKLFCVETGSMEPRYPVGDMIVVKAVGFEELAVDDVVTFRHGADTVVTHRIIEIDADSKQLTTKGDNNNVADASTVNYDQVIGKVIFDVPGAGYAILFLNTRFGRWMVIIAGLALIGVAFIRRMYYRGEDDEEAEAQEQKVLNEDGSTEEHTDGEDAKEEPEGDCVDVPEDDLLLEQNEELKE